MARVLFFLALIIAAASAFVAPAGQASVAGPAFTRSAAPEAPKMMIEGADVAISNVAANANLIATSVGDNGGYFFPIAGIGALAAFILFLAPPLADE
mmetsp:Transcript_10522/g.12649  ORF Transcript_10522/g.12649 Transcript_10522/m.12649 type:complete len:97 (+) Transcript_10522:408-698(+)|eukprot:CAMPEP_0195249290 /NCGR_PEP_ID=MMETSP0706-20130129/2029_1 /TAXON_ID=33640 /ORGANISM="Asterionellopsis glacialis, Strain CCMP134" /LENGTH=96 /DNA_ID=CAMNT_0040301067 /DNA_START=22 /DNA_END=312 /DNA_ORIENTATION=+